MKMATEYGKRLRAARKYAGLTQVQLAEKSGSPQSSISTAEREGYGSTETAVYANICGVNAVWLTNGSGEMLSRPSPPVGEALVKTKFSDMALGIAELFDDLPPSARVRAIAHSKITQALTAWDREPNEPVDDKHAEPGSPKKQTA
jgi:transcriptional regulator with XRE-family HTH domain